MPIDNMPIVKMTVEAMKLQTIQALTGFEEQIEQGLHEACARFDFAGELHRLYELEVRSALQRAMAAAAAELFRDDDVKTAMEQMVKKAMIGTILHDKETS